MVNPPPTHIRYVEQPVKAPQIYEGANAIQRNEIGMMLTKEVAAQG